MEKAGLKIEPLTRSTVSNFTGRVSGPLKEAKPQKSLIFSCLDKDPSLIWVLLGRRQIVMVNSPCYNFVMKKECHTHYFFDKTSQHVLKEKLWYLVVNKLAELFKAYTFQERIINKKQSRHN